MEQDLVNAEISGEDKTSIDTSIAAIQGKLPFLVSLSPKEKSSLFKVGENYKPFIQKAAQVISNHPEIMPGIFNTSGFLKDYNLFVSLEPILIKLRELTEALDDTVTAAGSDALLSSLEIYSSVKDHAEKIPGLKTVFDEMKI